MARFCGPLSEATYSSIAYPTVVEFGADAVAKTQMPWMHRSTWAKLEGVLLSVANIFLRGGIPAVEQVKACHTGVDHDLEEVWAIWRYWVPV